ncbi:unnamed protein product, partial [Laminaria digitata]
LQVQGVSTVSNPEILRVWQYLQVQRPEILGVILAVLKPGILRVLELPRVFFPRNTLLPGTGSICVRLHRNRVVAWSKWLFAAAIKTGKNDPSTVHVARVHRLTWKFANGTG